MCWLEAFAVSGLVIALGSASAVAQKKYDVSPRNVAEGQGLTHFGRQRKDSVAMCLVARLQSQPFSRD
jgi:hypothetical protein